MLSIEAEKFVGWSLNITYKGTKHRILMRSFLAKKKVSVGYNIEIMNYEKQSFNTTASFLRVFWKSRIKF